MSWSLFRAGHVVVSKKGKANEIIIISSVIVRMKVKLTREGKARKPLGLN